jgi:hypothetical protein
MASLFISVSFDFFVPVLRSLEAQEPMVALIQYESYLTLTSFVKKLGTRAENDRNPEYDKGSILSTRSPDWSGSQAAVILFYTLLSILILHIRRKSAVTNYVIGSIIWDLIFTGVCISMISLYSIAGVPANCGGLTRQNCKLPKYPKQTSI